MKNKTEIKIDKKTGHNTFVQYLRDIHRNEGIKEPLDEYIQSMSNNELINHAHDAVDRCITFTMEMSLLQMLGSLTEAKGDVPSMVSLKDLI